MDGIVFGMCGLFGIWGTALSARDAWRQRTRNEYRIARFARAVAFGVCTAGVTLAVPFVENIVESATGMNNAGKLGAHIFAVLWCGSLQLMLVDWSYNQDVLKASLYARVAFAVCVLAAMLPLFASTTENSMEFTTEYASIPGVTVYLMVYLGYVAVTCGEIAFLCSGMALVARRGRHTWSARGLALSTVSALLGVAYAASKGSYLVAHYLGHPWSLDKEEIVSPVLAGLAVITLITGLTMAMVGRRLASRKVPVSST
ncbi:hypothetical protein PV367_13730 [Streptomyces europaeiscabiei]|uniref:Uncharacterized protein n=1 Tax=Streptomyces europaeiscabiei TaxID=146819 RepID=A0AAJ2PNN8_9ACTN|nr:MULTISPECIES: hypothetical protein [Streptomyces]KFF98062.1 membrane protein [Streptomyces scabiei]MDX3130827.1 hypothetical protein [Streptomyces europaeiscabiei]